MGLCFFCCCSWEFSFVVCLSYLFFSKMNIQLKKIVRAIVSTRGLISAFFPMATMIPAMAVARTTSNSFRKNWT